MTGPVTVQRDGEAWTLSLARPDKRNALSSELVEELIDLVHKAPAEGARVLVFRGQGKNFSAGFDFSDLEQQSEGDLVLRFVRVEMLLQAVAASPCLTVALVHGRTFGAGVDLVASCRQRYATADSSFRMPGLKFGLVLGTRRFGAIVGRDNAAALQEEAATFDAARGQQLGFLHGISEQAEWPALVERARAKASSLPEWSRNALYEVLSAPDAEADLAWLVRSAARPGLKQRIAEYLRAG
ncbi:enoyl-CoA hydratase/isomerase family protein [Ramlibacter sp. PS3R-8]|uniref:enoyl-CoA hydratase/isomerase family protein n=1 Tax=Ramlibacter sp. PS3R-8 TaxID=3133437 RepID=UPI0030A2D175